MVIQGAPELQASFPFLKELKPTAVSLFDRFVVPPFSVLDARQGYWQERKRAWLSLGIQSELGRGKDLAYRQESLNKVKGDPLKGKRKYDEGRLLLGISSSVDFYYKKAELEKQLGRKLETSEFYDYYADMEQAKASYNTGTSIFDPVLCELAYRWFCPKEGLVLDPFAGGSVRGIVASYLGYEYIGVDLIERQVEANKEQAMTILQAEHNTPHWVVWDSRDLTELLGDKFSFDFIFTCPPYFDLEIYSDDPRDLSNAKGYGAFLESYENIITQSVALLKDNRFACIVVGDVRDKKGYYRGLAGDTIKAFEQAGAKLYNEAILITVVGSLPIRVGNYFSTLRKLGREHQSILIFYKGDIQRVRELSWLETAV